MREAVGWVGRVPCVSAQEAGLLAVEAEGEGERERRKYWRKRVGRRQEKGEEERRGGGGKEREGKGGRSSQATYFFLS